MVKKITLGALLATSMYANNFTQNGGLGLKVGTLGVGAEYTYNYSDKFASRIGINGYNYKKTGSESGIEYDINLKLQTISAIVDYHPFSNGFALSLGAMINNNKLDFNGRATGGNYTINGTTYTSAQVGTLKGNVDFNKLSPYIGLGYNSVSNKKGWSFMAELGALNQGSAKTTLTTTSSITAVQNDVAQEQQQLNDSISGLKWYPVVSLGIKYKF